MHDSSPQTRGGGSPAESKIWHQCMENHEARQGRGKRERGGESLGGDSCSKPQIKLPPLLQSPDVSIKGTPGAKHSHALRVDDTRILLVVSENFFSMRSVLMINVPVRERRLWLSAITIEQQPL
ncbi:hypothetical protein JDV02_006907 [Purpureocillium takamizusanense]|uniref:Uncharacterized protein n=1 Tax=Purpureocillium takamizusanense TaxID=2060973 RepID=A0A9Q8QJC4_9HYPO|nr:uncharacterized protein JDV02_006907 [Purpureocillium takamizusanense]UNI20858.1 hypothetical protein JDV02_006907 [Purpureocillium takamizusanense]